MDADRALFELAVGRKVAPRAALVRAREAALQRGQPLEERLRPLLDPVDMLALLRQRARVERRCAGCDARTWALAGHAACAACAGTLLPAPRAGCGAPPAVELEPARAPGESPSPLLEPDPALAPTRLELPPRAASALAVLEPATAPFHAQLGDALLLPLRSGESLVQLAGGSALLLLLQVTLAVAPWSALAGVVLLLGLYWSYLARLTAHGMRGATELASWPELLPWDLLSTFLRVLATLAACFWPAAACLGLAWKLQLPGLAVGALPAALGGLAYWPVAWLIAVAFQDGLLPFAYPVGLRAIAVAFSDYLLLLLVGAGLVLGEVGLHLLLGLVCPWPLALLLEAGVDCWIGLALATLVGRFYLANRARLGWFSR